MRVREMPPPGKLVRALWVQTQVSRQVGLARAEAWQAAVEPAAQRARREQELFLRL